MKLPKTIKRENSQQFLDLFFGELSHYSFGSMGKRDMDCLLLHSLLESNIVKYESNRDLANLLGINESKIKNYLLDIRFKYTDDNIDNNILTIINMILEEKKIKLAHEKDFYIFALEDPILRSDLEKKMKDLGYYADTSFNKEIVKIRDFAFVSFLYKFTSGGNTALTLKEIEGEISEKEREIAKILSSKGSLLTRSKKILSLATDTYSQVEILLKLIKIVIPLVSL